VNAGSSIQFEMRMPTPTFGHDGNTNRLAWLCADHKLSNLAALFPANADPGLARLNP